MKKIFFSVVATVIMSSVSVYAGGVKKVRHTNKHKVECGANCPETQSCHKAICPNKPGCVCK